MTPQLLTYVLFIVPVAYLVFNYLGYKRAKNRGYGYSFRPFYLIACVIVALIALFAILTGNTYEDISAWITRSVG